MFAVIRLGNHQYRVLPGQTITTEKLDGPEGSEVEFKDVLLVADGDRVLFGPAIQGAVFGRIKSQYRGPRITVFKKKRRKGYERKQGHRQAYTAVEITRIEV